MNSCNNTDVDLLTKLYTFQSPDHSILHSNDQRGNARSVLGSLAAQDQQKNLSLQMSKLREQLDAGKGNRGKVVNPKISDGTVSPAAGRGVVLQTKLTPPSMNNGIQNNRQPMTGASPKPLSLDRLPRKTTSASESQFGISRRTVTKAHPGGDSSSRTEFDDDEERGKLFFASVISVNSLGASGQDAEQSSWNVSSQEADGVDSQALRHENQTSPEGANIHPTSNSAVKIPGHSSARHHPHNLREMAMLDRSDEGESANRPPLAPAGILLLGQSQSHKKKLYPRSKFKIYQPMMAGVTVDLRETLIKRFFKSKFYSRCMAAFGMAEAGKGTNPPDQSIGDEPLTSSKRRRRGISERATSDNGYFTTARSKMAYTTFAWTMLLWGAVTFFLVIGDVLLPEWYFAIFAPLFLCWWLLDWSMTLNLTLLRMLLYNLDTIFYLAQGFAAFACFYLMFGDVRTFGTLFYLFICCGAPMGDAIWVSRKIFLFWGVAAPLLSLSLSFLAILKLGFFQNVRSFVVALPGSTVFTFDVVGTFFSICVNIFFISFNDLITVARFPKNKVTLLLMVKFQDLTPRFRTAAQKRDESKMDMVETKVIKANQTLHGAASPSASPLLDETPQALFADSDDGGADYLARKMASHALVKPAASCTAPDEAERSRIAFAGWPAGSPSPASYHDAASGAPAASFTTESLLPVPPGGSSKHRNELFKSGGAKPTSRRRYRTLVPMTYGFAIDQRDTVGNRITEWMQKKGIWRHGHSKVAPGSSGEPGPKGGKIRGDAIGDHHPDRLEGHARASTDQGTRKRQKRCSAFELGSWVVTWSILVLGFVMVVLTCLNFPMHPAIGIATVTAFGLDVIWHIPFWYHVHLSDRLYYGSFELWFQLFQVAIVFLFPSLFAVWCLTRCPSMIPF
jgi:hypothetical protein